MISDHFTAFPQGVIKTTPVGLGGPNLNGASLAASPNGCPNSKVVIENNQSR